MKETFSALAQIEKAKMAFASAERLARTAIVNTLKPLGEEGVQVSVDEDIRGEVYDPMTEIEPGVFKYIERLRVTGEGKIEMMVDGVWRGLEGTEDLHLILYVLERVVFDQ